MVQCLSTHIDASFAALSDVTRRGVLEELGRADASITELAAKFRMTLTGMKKHVGILEQAGLVSTQKIGRVRTCTLDRDGLALAERWLTQRRTFWEHNLDRLGEVLAEPAPAVPTPARKKP